MCVQCNDTFHRRVVWPQEKGEQASGLQQPLAELVEPMTQLVQLAKSQK